MNGDFYVGRVYGISIIPDENIPPGYKHTKGSDIFINEHNYDLMKQFSAKGMLIALGTLREVQQKPKEQDMAKEWEEFKRIIDEWNPDAGPMPEDQFKRFQELLKTIKTPARQPDTRTLEEVIDDLNDYRKQKIHEQEP